MNRRAKFDAASFILGGEICNRTNTQTVTDICTPRLWACVDNNVMFLKLTCILEQVAADYSGTDSMCVICVCHL